MQIAWIDGKPATRDEALRVAGDLFAKARQPFIGGLRTDVSGLRAAFALARRSGAVVDHGASSSIYGLVSAARDAGAFLAAPAEMRRRADRVLIVGDDAGRVGGDVLKLLAETKPDLGVETRKSGRRFLALSRQAVAIDPGSDISHLDCASKGVVDVLGMVRAKLAGRRVAEGPVGAGAVETLAAFLGEAGFAAIVFSPAEFGEIGTEMILGLASDLNDTTRASTLPVVEWPDAMGAALVATWTSGFPLRVSFGRGAGEHDALLNATERQLSDEGEADLVVLVDALAGETSALPEFVRPAILIAADPAGPSAAKVVFKVAAAGRDHDGVLYEPRFGSFVGVTGKNESGLPTVAEILDALAGTPGGTAAEAA